MKIFQSAFVLLLASLILVISAETNKSEVCCNWISDHAWSPYYQVLLSAARHVGVENECIEQIQNIFVNLKQGELWALKAFDASGTLPSGFMYAKNSWDGSQKGCDILNGGYEIFMSNEYKKKLVTAAAPFPMKYFTLYINYTTPNQILIPTAYEVPIHLGVCLPQSCNSESITNISRNIFNESSGFRNLYNVTMEVIGVKDTSLMKFFQRLETMAIIIAILAVVLLVATMNLLRPFVKHKLFTQISDCFDIYKNLNDLMDMKIPSGDIATLAGIKTMVCVVILILHFGYYSSFSYNNRGEIAYYSAELSTIVFTLGTVFVDAFFVISAFLVTHNFLKNEKRKEAIKANGTMQNSKLYFKLLLHRYIRLTPPLLFTVALGHLTALYMNDATQYYVTENWDNYCKPNSWWRTIFYVQSFYPFQEMCGTWTWYLSADMMYFVIALVGLFIYVKKPLLMKFMFFCISALIIIYSFYVNYNLNYNYALDDVYRTVSTIYIAPLLRMSPYLSGILGGYLMYQLKDSTVKISKIAQFSWTVAEWGTLIFLVFFLRHFRFLPRIFGQLANSLGRYCFGCLVVWTIIINNFEYDGAFRKLMGYKLFIHLNKLTYMAYLIFPTIVYIYRAASETAIPFGIVLACLESFGMILVCYFVSLILTLFFEVPFCRLSSEFLMKRTKMLDENKNTGEEIR